MKILNKRCLTPLLLTFLMMVMMIAPKTGLAAESPVNLGTTESFAVLAGSAITNTGSTTIGGSAGGNIGVSPGSAITGFPPGIVSDGTIHASDAASSQAKADLVTAYNDAAGRSVTKDLTDKDLGGLTLTSGVYSFNSSAKLTGTLTLDAQGNSESVFVFRIGSTLTTASDSVVSLINGARYCRVFWQVGSSATLATKTNFVGHIFALTSITANTGAKMQGQLLAINGAVTLDTNTITNGICESAPANTTLHVVTHVINDNGGTATASNFKVHVMASGSDVSGSPANGAVSPGTTYTLSPGTYVVSAGAFTGYSLSYKGDSDSSGNITLASGDNKTVTITGDDIPSSGQPATPSSGESATPSSGEPATLKVILKVKNNDGRKATASDFDVHVMTSGSDVSGSPANGAVSPGGKTYKLPAGTYVVSVDAFTGYSFSYRGDSDSSGNITLASGDNKTVTITSDDNPYNPKTGQYTDDNFWIGITAAGLGVILILTGIMLYLHLQRKKQA